MGAFGNTELLAQSYATVENFIKGGYFQMDAVDGVGDSITVLIIVTTTAHKMKCALYKADNTLVPNSVTEEITVPVQGGTAFTFHFGATKPDLVANAWYYIVVWAEATTGNAYYCFYNSGGNGVFYDSEAYDGFPDPWAGTPGTTGLNPALYCTYNGGGTALTLALSDSFTLGESIRFDIGVKMSDSLALAETLTTQATFNLALSDILTLDDELTAELTAAIAKITKGAIARKIGLPTMQNIGF